jgi:hypothetical protein
MIRIISALTVILGFFLLSSAKAEAPNRPVVIYNEVPAEIGVSPEKANDVWLTIDDLKRATHLEVKPEGVCTAQSCVPLPKGREADFVAKRGGETWFNLSEFARLLKQPIAHDAKHAVWYFGPRPDVQNRPLKTLAAPDFTLEDVNGRKHSLSDFRGKKILLITWASW